MSWHEVAPTRETFVVAIARLRHCFVVKQQGGGVGDSVVRCQARAVQCLAVQTEAAMRLSLPTKTDERAWIR